MNRLIINDKAAKLAKTNSGQELWDKYKAAKLMGDKVEVSIFRKALKLRQETLAS